MLRERKFVLSQRIIWLVLWLLCFIIPFFCSVFATPDNQDELQISSSNGSIIEYSQSLDTTQCLVQITFNRDVYSGNISVTFYKSEEDEEGVTKTEYFTHDSSDNALYAYFLVNFEVEYFEVVDYSEIEPYQSADSSYLAMTICLGLSVPIFIVFIMTLLLSYKKYIYYGTEIIVYAGYYHHYIKVNGSKFDEHNTLVSFTPICMSCMVDDYTCVQTTISLTNRISTQINGRLISPEKH